jgi:hypothetical protein
MAPSETNLPAGNPHEWQEKTISRIAFKINQQ